jgi:hypothetical protein
MQDREDSIPWRGDERRHLELGFEGPVETSLSSLAGDAMARFLGADLSQQRHRVSVLFLVITIGFGLTQIWACRYEMNPDSMDYLDIAREVAAGHWAAIANGYWGTLNSLLLAPLFRFRLSPETELLLAHLGGIVTLLFAFFSFRHFLNSLLDTTNLRGDAELRSPPEWALCVLGYSLFLWSSLTMVGVSAIGPDLLVTVFIYLAASILLRVQRETHPLSFVVFGLTLGVGYWAKAIMFPIGLVFLAVSIFRVRRWKQGLFSMLAFALAAAPLLLMLSLPRGRFTFGDSGKLNYSAMVSPGGRAINWQGDPIASGVPKHPTRRLADLAIYEFNGPVPGTYPPSYDPSYWNEGRRATFSLRSQLRTILRHIPHVFELFFIAEPGLTAGFLFLWFWNSRGFLAGLTRRWELLTISGVIVGLYMLVHFEARFVGAFLVLVWLSVFLSLCLPANKDSQLIAGLSILALVVAMLLSLVSNTAKKLVNGCPESARSQLEMADQLAIPTDTRIAVVGNGNFSYWAYFARLRIVADIMSSDAPDFWRRSEQERQVFYATFRKTGARWLIGQPPPGLANLLDARWQRVGTTTYYRYSLDP